MLVLRVACVVMWFDVCLLCLWWCVLVLICYDMFLLLFAVFVVVVLVWCYWFLVVYVLFVLCRLLVYVCWLCC